MTADHSPAVDHHRVAASRRKSRRTLLFDLGGVAVGALVLGACSSSGSSSAAGSTVGTSPDTDPERNVGSASPPSAEDQPSAEVVENDLASGNAGTWERVNMGFVSAYVLVRQGETIVVDTGPSGNEQAIGALLNSLGVEWNSVSDVILTHRHPDHVGSLGAIIEQAPDAARWTGAADLDAIGQDLGLVGVADGDEIAGLRVIGTPGHTAGHISIHDPLGGVLVAGDALNGGRAGSEGELTGPNPDFTDDLDLANASVSTLAGFEYDTVLVGHGEPVTENGSALVAALAEDLR